MKRVLSVAFLFVAIQISAQLMPLTNTRYGVAPGRANALRTNGTDLFLFWNTAESIRATKLAEGYDRAGQALLASRVGNFDATWTGSGFLFAGDSYVYMPTAQFSIFGRRLDANAQPAGAPFVIVSDALIPRLASSRDAVVMLYATTTSGDRMIVLSHSGQAMSPSTALDGSHGQATVASNGNGFVVAVPFDHGIRIQRLDSKGQSVAEQVVPMAESYRAVALGAHGSQYLLAIATQTGVQAMTIDEQGALGSALFLDDTPQYPALRDLSVAWNGDGWSVAFGRYNAAIAHITRNADRIIRKEAIAGGAGTSLAEFDGRMRAAWETQSGTRFADLPLAGTTPRPVTFGAVDQALDAIAVSQKGTLVVWREGGWHAGLRTHAGDWSEHTLGPILGNDALLASDGRNFALVTFWSDMVRVYLLDEDGRLRTTVSFGDLYTARDVAVTWDGTHYAIVGGDEVRLVSPSGEVSAPATLPFGFYGPHSIASNGHGYLVTVARQECPFILCYSTEVLGVRLGPSLDRLDATDLVLANDEYLVATGAVWNGNEYALAWQSDAGAFLTSVPATEGTPTRHPVDVPLDEASSMVATSGGSLAIVSGASVHFVSNSGTVLRRDFMDRDSDPRYATRPLLAALPNGGATYVAARARMEPPIHGATHVMFGIAGQSGVVPPAPHASIALSNTRIEVTWTPPAGVVNGYRVEYRVDNGNWLEVERYYGPGELTASVARPAQGSELSIRVRAFNDAGASSYSNIATMTKPRRRSTR